MKYKEAKVVLTMDARVEEGEMVAESIKKKAAKLFFLSLM